MTDASSSASAIIQSSEAATHILSTNRQRGQRLRRQRERAARANDNVVPTGRGIRRNRQQAQQVRRQNQAAAREERLHSQRLHVDSDHRVTETSSIVEIPNGFKHGDSLFQIGESSTSRSLVPDTNMADDDRHEHTTETIDEYVELPQITQVHTERGHDLGHMDVVCVHCGALHWMAERLSKSSVASPRFGKCCMQGEIRLQPYDEPPMAIKALYEGTDRFSKSFLENIRQLNATFAFTSLGSPMQRRVQVGSGPPNFILHGELMHLTGALLPENSNAPVFSQLYIYDPHTALQERQQRNANLMPELLSFIQANILRYNPFVGLFQQAHEILSDRAEEEESEDIRVSLHYTSQTDRRTYNQPTVEEVALILPGDGTEITAPRDILLRLRSDSGLIRINECNPLYLPLHYVLLFPTGNLGYEENLTHWDVKRNSEKVGRNVTLLEFYSYRLFQRQFEYSVLFRAGKLFQEFLVDAWAATEQNRLHYIKTHQADFRVDLYKDLTETDANNHRRADQIGQRFILPSSFTAGPRQMHEIFQDSMAITRHYKHPDIFLTMTANPQWPEIIDAIGVNRSPSDRPDIVARVFELKRKALVKTILDRKVFGKVVAYVYTIEFQKRGLPHMHALFFLDEPQKIRTPEQVDRFVSAELPDPVQNPGLFEIVKRRMIHGPCGLRNPEAVCMKGSVCTKRYPKIFAESTSIQTDGYPLYQRRENGMSFVRGRHKIDNRDVVPYNPFLTQKFNCHINVEVCAGIRCVKYINKYLYKGHDRTTLIISNDEIKQYLDARYIGPPEAAWRLLAYKLHKEYPNVYRLDLHLPGEQRVVFNPRQTLRDIGRQAGRVNSKLMAFFECCRLDEAARALTYQDFPRHYSWHSDGYFWFRRTHQTDTIGRMYFASPNSGERFYLRLLLIHAKGPTSWLDLKTWNGTTHATFKQACVAKGLLEDDGEWIQCLQEASAMKTGNQLRRLFVIIMTQCSPTHPEELWDTFKSSICDDLPYILQATRFSRAPTEIEVTDYGLYLLNQILEEYGKCLKDFPPMPLPLLPWDNIPIDNKLLWEHMQLRHDPKTIEARNTVSLLNVDQRRAFDEVLSSVEENKGTIFFLNGGAGTGKTFLYNTIAGYCRDMGRIVITTASSGIAALLLVGGRTAHSTFSIPFDPLENSVCSFSKQSNQAELFRRARLIIWDEVPMQHRYCIDAVDRTLQDVRDNCRPFGGITVVLGGDFRQTLPVIAKGTREEIIASTIKKSPIWPYVHILHLFCNMRLNRSDPKNADFARYLLQIGTQPEETIKLPDEIKKCSNLAALIHEIYPDLHVPGIPTSEYLTERVILAARNDDVNSINDEVLNQFPGTANIFISADKNVAEELNNTEVTNRYPIEYLNTLNPSGLSPCNLHLKIGCPVILLRNLQPRNGLCNGTRLKIVNFGQTVVEAEILTGDKSGSLVFIPRISLTPSSKESPVLMTRRQFPIRPAFALTINKSQGQSVKFVGIDLQTPVFTHGQLYVALSRCTTVNHICALLPNADGITTNIVYPEVLE